MTSGCPCGEAHEFSVEMAYENIIRGLPETVLVVIGSCGWRVPRVYIAAHGLSTADLPDLAARYQWTEVAV